jgi:hypothetical protein
MALSLKERGPTPRARTRGAGREALTADFNGGTVFQLTPPAKGKTAWTHAVLYSFARRRTAPTATNPSTA